MRDDSLSHELSVFLEVKAITYKTQKGIVMMHLVTITQLSSVFFEQIYIPDTQWCIDPWDAGYC